MKAKKIINRNKLMKKPTSNNKIREIPIYVQYKKLYIGGERMLNKI